MKPFVKMSKNLFVKSCKILQTTFPTHRLNSHLVVDVFFKDDKNFVRWVVGGLGEVAFLALLQGWLCVGVLCAFQMC